MNSQVSKFEKSAEDCVNYNFDESPKLVKKSQRQLNRAKSLGGQFNGKLIIQKKWLECKNSFAWLYVLNDNPKCSVCEELMKKDKMTDKYGTNSMSNFENINDINEEKFLQTHQMSENHTKAFDFFSDTVSNLIDYKLEKENNIPSFVSILEWNQLKNQFPWLCFKNELFGCLLCEEYCSKQIKPYHVLTILGNSSRKNLRDFKAFNKHVSSIIHTNALEIVQTEETISTNKEQTKRSSNIIPKKPMNFSPPNVTTRTAIQKSLCDRNTIPDCIDKQSWDSLKITYPWLYSNQNVMRCAYCEDAFKNHNESMVQTQWTDPKSTENKPVNSLKDLRTKYRLNQHGSSKNHEIAAKALKLFQSAVKIEKVNVPVEKQELKKSNKEATEKKLDLSENFKIAIKASRKSAPFKLTNLSYENKLSNSRENYSRENKDVKSLVLSEDSKSIIKSVSSFLQTNEYLNLKSKYDWLDYSNENSFHCSVCLEAVKIDRNVSTYSNSEIFEPDITYSEFRNKLDLHSSSINHIACVAKLGGINNHSDKQETNPKINSPEFRSTRLKTGSKTKIDYKRMSEGYIQTDNNKEYPRVPAAAAAAPPVQQQHVKRNKESSITWVCPQCKSHFRNTDDLIQHISLCDYQLSDSKNELACPCNSLMFRFNTITKLDLHAAQEHDNQTYFHCYICSDRYNRLTSLYNHMLIHHLITSWDPFEAYSPVKPFESFLCIFCNCNFPTNILLTKHYCLSDCYRYLQPSIILLQNISPVQQFEKFTIQEEVTVLDVEELPDEKEVIYSPIKKSTNQHNRISRNHPLRRFGSRKKDNIKQSFSSIKNSMKNKEIENKSLNNDDIKSIESIKENSPNKSINQSKLEESKSSEIDIDSNNKSENNNNNHIDQIKVPEKSEEPNKICDKLSNNESKIDVLVSETNNNDLNLNIDMDAEEYEILMKKDVSNTETNKPEHNIDMDAEIDTGSTVNPQKNIDIKENHHKITGTNKNMINSHKNEKSEVKQELSKTNESNIVKKSKKPKIDKVKTPINKTKRINKTKLNNKSLFKTTAKQQIIPEKVVMHQIVDLNDIITETESKKLLTQAKKLNNSNTNHSKLMTKSNKKEPIRIQSQFSPDKKIVVSECLPSNNEIPSGLSFMDRMRKIRQLKKNRTEQQREEMMAIDRKNAEIYEKTNGQTNSEKPDRIKKIILNSPQNSTNDLKTISQLENAKSKPHNPNKRKLSNDENSGTITTPKQSKIIETVKIPNSTSPAKIETFSCDVCQLKFKSLRARDSHATAEHKGLKLFCCKVCNLSFTTHILLRKHAQKYHIDNVALAVFGIENSSEINFSFSCTFCPLQFTSRSGLNHHITSGHRSETDTPQVLSDFLTKLIAADPNFSPQSCLICQEIMNNEFELDIHTIEHQKECQTAEVEPTQFACPKCCRLFFGKDGKSYLKDHYNIVHLQKSLPSCEECDMKFNSTVCYLMHRKYVKNCSKKTTDQLKIEDPYEKLNDLSKLAFACSRCQTLIAGHSAETRFEEHKLECCSITDKNEDSIVNKSQSEIVDGELKLDMNL